MTTRVRQDKDRGDSAEESDNAGATNARREPSKERRMVEVPPRELARPGKVIGLIREKGKQNSEQNLDSHGQ